MAMWIGVLLLAGLAIFIVWDSRRLSRGSGKPLSRDTVRSGFAPHGIEGWHFWLGMGVITALLAFMEFDSPSSMPATGRWGWLWNLGYQILGDQGKLVLLASFAVLMLIFGLSGLLSQRLK